MMNGGFLFSFVIHSVLELVTACALIYWISEAWARTPAPALVRLARHPVRLWIAMGLAILPSVFATLFVALMFSGEHPARIARIIMPVFYVLSLFYGILKGLAATCCAGSGERLHIRGAFVTAIVLVFAPPWYWAGSRWLFLGIHVFFLVLIVVVAYFVLVNKNETPDSQSAHVPPPLPAQPPRTSPLIALLIGFAPTFFILIMITLASTGAADHMSNDESRVLLGLASAASVACCVISSILLFKRKTGAAIAGAVLLLLLNVCLSFFFGCCALLVGESFH